MASVVVTITCDWEGWKLEAGDLQAMKMLNEGLSLLSKQNPIPVTHFICPAYFSRIDPKNEKARETEAQKILDSGAIKPNDEIGVHVHCWKSLALESGINEKQFNLTPIGLVTATNQYIYRDANVEEDVGYTVPLGAYDLDDATRFIDGARTLIQKYLKVKAPLATFRCGMWVACDVVFKALSAANISIDASAVPFSYIKTAVKENFGLANLDSWNIAIWGNTLQTGDPWVRNSLSFATYKNGISGMLDKEFSQPAKIGGTLEIPDTSMLIPWTNGELMRGHVIQAFELAKEMKKEVYISIGLHQENSGKAASFAVKGYPVSDEEKKRRTNGIVLAVVRALSTLETSGIPMSFLTVSEAAKKALG